jgi:hypothetical protein
MLSVLSHSLLSFCPVKRGFVWRFCRHWERKIIIDYSSKTVGFIPTPRVTRLRIDSLDELSSRQSHHDNNSSILWEGRVTDDVPIPVKAPDHSFGRNKGTTGKGSQEIVTLADRAPDHLIFDS